MGTTSWLDRRILDLFGIEIPIIQAPVAGATTAALILGVARAGGLGSLPLGMATADDARAALAALGDTADTGALPLNLNFFCHGGAAPEDPAREQDGSTGCSPGSRSWACGHRRSRCRGLTPASEPGSAS